jgi:SAM-dependent methyltransferase
MRLNLGCCDRHLEGFCNVDLAPPADVIADLEHDWPWEDGSVEGIVADDIFEHLADKIHTMNEAWRVLEPDGKLQLRVPTTAGWGAFQDPTHCSFWTPNDLLYYTDGTAERERFGDHYGISARFSVLKSGHRRVNENVWYLLALLEATK